MWMIFILFIIIGSSLGMDSSTAYPIISSLSHNSSHIILQCPPSQSFISTHMAPDFESPQLVRRLDWFHDDTLIGSYQQNVIEDSSRQWWVEDGRYRLEKPFYSLRISPVLAEDSGLYRCRLETDPLFSLTMTSATIELTVMVRPVAPSAPEVKSATNRSITLLWIHNTARAHRPILRFSIIVRSSSDSTIIASPSNATSVIVDNLSPFTLYSFAVRAENSAGISDFGPETKFRTLGEAPHRPPRLISINNSSIEGCVIIILQSPDDMHSHLNGYSILLRKNNETQERKEYFASSDPITLCHLHPYSSYIITIQADNGFGLSPSITHQFHTHQPVASSAPTNISLTAAVGRPILIIRWNPPFNSTAIITSYNIYIKADSDTKWKHEHINVGKKEKMMYHAELQSLVPNTRYSVRISASTGKGEGQKSSIYYANTDITAHTVPQLTNISFDCKNGIKLSWRGCGNKSEYRIELSNRTRSITFNTTINKLDVIDLSLHEEYSIRIKCSLKSIIDNSSSISSEWAHFHRFVLNDQCSYQSSLCLPNSKCMSLTQQTNSTSFSLLISLGALILFLSFCIVIGYSLRRYCIDIKSLLKKKEKCIYLEELSPLVYDAVGCEDIPVELFYGYCEDLARNENAKYIAQFEQIEQMTANDCTEQEILEKNLDKNRYLNIGAIDSTRIRISTSTGSDYINANYIDSCERRNAYIATQAPLPSTFSDFWSMIWQERCNIIVVITNMVEDGRRKCDQYWPCSTQSVQNHGSFNVGFVREVVNTHFVHRTLSLRIAKSVPPTERRIHQLHYTGWPDHGIPQSVFPLLTFMNYVSDIHSTGPIVVHCSAGVGRSGSFILMDSMRRHLINFRRLNLMGHLLHMRRQREKLVQTVDQYILCHEAVRQLIRHGITRVHTDLFQRYLHYLAEENVNGKTRIQMQFEDLCECKHSPVCVPSSEYIVLPGYHRNDEFVVGSWLCESEDLWRLVWQKSCQTIILIGDESYWRGINQTDEMSIQHGDQFVLLQNKEDQLCVRIVTVSKHRLQSNFWDEMERIQTERLSYHHAPLFILYARKDDIPITPPSPFHSLSSNKIIIRGEQTSSTLSLLTNDYSPSLAYCICALTSLACQLEQEGCVDVVQILSSYSYIQCGIWSSRQDVEMIYDKLSYLINGSRV